MTDHFHIVLPKRRRPESPIPRPSFFIAKNTPSTINAGEGEQIQTIPGEGKEHDGKGEQMAIRSEDGVAAGPQSKSEVPHLRRGDRLLRAAVIDTGFI